MKQNQRYTAEFRTEAVRMVLEQGLSQAEVAARLGIPKGSLANWVVKARGPSKPFSGVAEASREELQAEVVRLRRALARAEMERETTGSQVPYTCLCPSHIDTNASLTHCRIGLNGCEAGTKSSSLICVNNCSLYPSSPRMPSSLMGQAL